MISLRHTGKNHEIERTSFGGGGVVTSLKTGYCHDLSNEEKKNSSDNFELHLKLPVGTGEHHDDCSCTYILILFPLPEILFTGLTHCLQYCRLSPK